jgi:acyl dehydratase
MATEEITDAPNLLRLYVKALASGIGGSGEALPDTELVLRDIEIDRDHLAAYDRVCGFRLGNTLPATYLHVLAFPLSMAIMTERTFPFALPGVVHIGNRISQLRPLDAEERFDLTVRTENLRPHEKGQQFDVVAEATVNGELVWTDTSTNLRRGGGGERSADGGDSTGAATRAQPHSPPQAVWRVPSDMGRRYAAVSGDVNPIHLNPLTARVFGFPRPIAHGMWTAARVLASLEGRLPDQLDYSVEFKLPLLLPATVALSVERAGHAHRVAVRGARDGKPHLLGEVAPR